MRIKYYAVLLVFLLAVPLMAHEEVKNLTLSAKGIELLDIDCGAGFLKIRGVKGITDIEVEAEIIITGMSSRKAKDYSQENVRLKLRRNGRKAYLLSEFKPHFSLVNFGTRVINLTVSVPRAMPLKIDDGSGFMTIENIDGGLTIDDGSGRIMISGITGDVEIDDSSGEIQLDDIQGDVTIDDGSGGLRLENIGGNVDISDGSGGIQVMDVIGNVTIRDGSGSIRVNGVEKDVIIKSDGSGGVRISNVKGKVIR